MYLKEIQNKGVGVFASRKIPANRTLMYYKLKIFNSLQHSSVSNGEYSFYVYKRVQDNYQEDVDHYADIYNESNSNPKGRIPFWVRFNFFKVFKNQSKTLFFSFGFLFRFSSP